MYALAKGEFFGAHAPVQLSGKCWRKLHVGTQESVPELCGGRRRLRSPNGTAHAVLAPARRFSGAPVKPVAAPMPNISSQRGHEFAGEPRSARSITRRAMRSTTVSK